MDQKITTPITIRLPENKLNLLKEAARKQAAEKGTDISYSDIVRDLINQYITNDPSLNTKSESENDNNNNLPTYEHVKTPEDLHALLSYTLADVMAGVKDIVVDEISNNIENFLNSNSLPRQVLHVDRLPAGGKPEYDITQYSSYGKSSGENILMVPIRGAEPRCVKLENNKFIIPMFEIATCPGLSCECCWETCQLNIDSINLGINKSIHNITREENVNFINLLEETVKKTGNKIYLSMSHPSEQEFAVIMPVSIRKKLDNNTLKNDNLNGILNKARNIIYKPKLHQNEGKKLFIIYNPHKCGVMPIHPFPKIIQASESKRLKASVVIIESLGMCINTDNVYEIDLTDVDY